MQMEFLLRELTTEFSTNIDKTNKLWYNAKKDIRERKQNNDSI